MAPEGQDRYRRMKFMLDECLSHHFVGRLVGRGYPDAVHPIHIGLRSRRDDLIFDRAMADDRIIVTTNARDYRPLLSRQSVHAGAIMLPNAEKEESWRLIEVALAFIELQPDPADYMVNRVVEVSATEGIRPYELPPAQDA